MVSLNTRKQLFRHRSPAERAARNTAPCACGEKSKLLDWECVVAHPNQDGIEEGEHVMETAQFHEAIDECGYPKKDQEPAKTLQLEGVEISEEKSIKESVDGLVQLARRITRGEEFDRTDLANAVRRCLARLDHKKEPNEELARPPEIAIVEGLKLLRGASYAQDDAMINVDAVTIPL